MSNRSPRTDGTTTRLLHIAAACTAVGLLVAAGVGTAVAQISVADGTVFEAGDDGPTVETTEALTLDSPFDYPDAHTVDLSPNATFESDGATNVTVDSIDGEWTNLTTHDVSAGLTVDPADKQAVTIEGDTVSAVAFRDVDPASGRADLTYDADGELDVTIETLPADATVYAVALEEGERLDDATTGGSGTATLALPAGEDRRVDIRTVRLPTVDNASATPVDETVGPTPTLELDVASAAFPYDSLEANVTLDGERIANRTLTENGTVTVAPDRLDRGERYAWNVTVTDSFGREVDSETFGFSVSTPDSSGGSSASADGDVRSVRIQGDDLSATVAVTEANGVATSSLDVTAGTDSTVDLEFENDDSAEQTTLQRLEIQTGSEIGGELTIRQGSSAGAVGGDDVEPLEAATDAEPAAYLSVETDFDEAVESATFEVRVPAGRFDNREATDVTVYHYVDSEWVPLETTLVDDSGGSDTFEATSNGLSMFAVGIGSVEASNRANTATETNNPAENGGRSNTATETNTAAQDIGTMNTTVDAASEESPGFGVITAVLALLVGALFLSRQR